MNPEKRELILDLMDEGRNARREATLLAGGRILARRRWQRLGARSLAAAAILGIAVFAIQKSTTPRPRVLAAVPAPPAEVHALTDDELLALFPNTPVGLASLEHGKKRLIFPRAGDEERFVTRL
jgi:hypothetical protein